MPEQPAVHWVKRVGKAGVRAAAMATASWRQLPDVVIIGVKRGGTTSLFRDLEQHPAMCPLVPSARRLPLRENMKGVHYFDTNVDNGPRWYRSHFPTTLTRRRRAATAGGAFTAEASPYYFFHPLAAQRAVRGLPSGTVFVVMLRDPVERTISHWSEQTRNGVEALSLDDALDAEAGRVGDAGKQLAAGTLPFSHAHEQQSYMAQSRYTDSLQRWFDAAGRDRVLVVFSEDYYSDPASIVKKVTDRLGLAAAPRETGEHRNAASRPGVLTPVLDKRLTDLFRSDVAELTTLLGTVPPWPRFANSSHAGAEPIQPR